MQIEVMTADKLSERLTICWWWPVLSSLLWCAGEVAQGGCGPSKLGKPVEEDQLCDGDGTGQWEGNWKLSWTTLLILSMLSWDDLATVKPQTHPAMCLKVPQHPVPPTSTDWDSKPDTLTVQLSPPQISHMYIQTDTVWVYVACWAYTYSIYT